MGNATYVQCAENQIRYGVCSNLKICTLEDSVGENYVLHNFPSDFVSVVSSYDEMAQMLLDEHCNVLGQTRSALLYFASLPEVKDKGFVVGNDTLSKKPLAIVSRLDDREFNEIINWAMQALFFGEEKALAKNSSLCQDYSTTSGLQVSDLNFLNAVYCVGSYSGILSPFDRGMNQINNGSSGMIYAYPFGELDNEDTELIDGSNLNDTCLCDHLRDEDSLNCGILVPSSGKLVGLHVDYCRTLAAALFNGDAEAVKIIFLEDDTDDAYLALENQTIDVLAGAVLHKRFYFESSLSPSGFHFSTPYYYGDEAADEDLTIYALATRKEDTLFSSFVNAIVIATIYATEEGITKDKSNDMPLSNLFGGNFTWSLRDAIAYSGGYDELYKKHFGDVSKVARGRNTLTNMGTPQIHSIPGLSL